MATRIAPAELVAGDRGRLASCDEPRPAERPNAPPPTVASVVTPPVHIEPSRAPPTVEPSPPIFGWALVGTGVVGLGVGVAGFIVSDAARSVAADTARPLETREVANEDGETWWNVGLISGGVGALALVSGIVLVATHEPHEPATVYVGGSMWPGGGAVTTSFQF